MDRRFEWESLRRSLAMLRPGEQALNREDAMRLLSELQDLEWRLRRLKNGLQELIQTVDRGPDPVVPGAPDRCAAEG
jgi:hypothetical protein